MWAKKYRHYFGKNRSRTLVPWLKYQALVFGCMYSLSASAIVSMENIHLGAPEQGFQGSFELGADIEDGNTEKSGGKAGFKLQWVRDNVIDFILSSYDYGESAGIKDKNKGFAHYRHIAPIRDNIAWEGFTQFSVNEFTNLKLRALLGGGIRYAVQQKTDKQALFFGLGAFLEHEDLDPSVSNESDNEDTLRVNSYVVLKHQFNDYVSLVSTTYYQPSVEDIDDYRAIEELAIVSQLAEKLALKVSLDVIHDNQPPEGVEKTDTALSLGVVYSF